MLESDFVPIFKKEVESRFPGGFWMKNDSAMIGGIPDLTYLFGRNWAIFETKRGMRAAKQNHQEYYVNKFDNMSFAAFVNPENYLDVLDEMERVFD